MPTPETVRNVTVRNRAVTADRSGMDPELVLAVGTAVAAVLTAATPLLLHALDEHDEQAAGPVAGCQHLELPPVPPRRKAHA